MTTTYIYKKNIDMNTLKGFGKLLFIYLIGVKYFLFYMSMKVKASDTLYIDQ